MNTKTLFQKYHERLTREGILKSVLFSFIASFILLFVSSLIFWFFGIKNFWIPIVLSTVFFAAACPIVYSKKFKPTTKAIAKRIDELGLEERLLTMTELENDTSFIAMKQREDALSALKSVNSGLIKIIVTAPVWVAFGISAVFGVGMTTASALAEKNIIKNGIAIVDPEPDPIYYELEYEAGEGGLIEGEIFQTVVEGEDGSMVIAIADEEYIFVGWSDMLEKGEKAESPDRTDLDVRGNVKVTAIFIETDETDGKPDEGPKDGEADDAPDKPSEGEPSGGNPSEGSGEGGGGVYEANDNIIDNNTDYGDFYDNAYGEAMDSISKNGELSDLEKKIISDYYNSIAKNKNKQK